MKLFEAFNLHGPNLQINLTCVRPTKSLRVARLLFTTKPLWKFHVITFLTSDKWQAELTIEQNSGFEKGLHGPKFN